MGKSNSRYVSGSFATSAIHYGYDPVDFYGASTPFVFMTSTYAFESIEGAKALLPGEREGYA
jgi:methionine-gamma-lyase